MPFAPALASLLLIALPWSRAPAVAIHRVGIWTVRVSPDRFRDQTTCRLSAAGVDYTRGVLVLRLPRRTDTSAAAYRVDAAAPVAVGAEAADMARRGFAIYRDDLANPSGGLVRIPEARLAGARVVSVQARPMGAVVRFRVDGLGAALDAARAFGCASNAFDGAEAL